MAMTKKCDLCGSLYECYTKSELKNGGVFNGIEFIWMDADGVAYRGNDIRYKNLHRLDLCRECKDRLIELIDTIRKEAGIYD